MKSITYAKERKKVKKDINPPAIKLFYRRCTITHYYYPSFKYSIVA